MSGDQRTAGAEPAISLRHAVAAGRIALRAAPGPLLGYLALTLVSGVLPVVVAWLTRAVLDLLPAGTARSLVGLSAGLAAAGLAAAAVPHLTQYARMEQERAVGLYAQDRLFRAVDRFSGLGRFEHPRFLDRLRLAQQVGGTAPNRAVDGALGVVRASVTVAGFLSSLFVLGPLLAALVLAAGLPALAAEIALSRRRAGVLWDIGPAERREFFYSHLLGSVAAAKEVRLFGIGGLLRGRMLAERRAANAAKRAVDRREALSQSALALVAALVAGCGLVWAVDRAHRAMLLFDHYLAVTTAGPDLPVAARPRPLPELRRGIELRDVWFRYSENAAVGAARRRPVPGAGDDARPGWAQRRGQVDPRQAAVPVLRPHPRVDPVGRCRPPRRRAGRPAPPDRRRLPGLHALRLVHDRERSPITARSGSTSNGKVRRATGSSYGAGRHRLPTRPGRPCDWRPHAAVAPGG